MSKLNELIEELCPNGVPFKKLKEVYTRLKGSLFKVYSKKFIGLL